MNVNSVRSRLLTLLSIVIVTGFLFGCGGGPKGLPIEALKEHLKADPSYSVILEDMKEEGTFGKRYFHQYRVVREENSGLTKWMQVPKDYYKAHEEYLGMSLAVKKEGEVDTTVSPPGYQYVGDSRYGEWKQDNSGNSFWAFYGKYALFSSLFGGWYRPIYRNDFSAYQQHRSRNTPFFGRGREYGTKGTVVKTNKPNFYARRNARQNLRNAGFKDRVNKRVGRTRTGYRSRAGGFGK
jgi:hypothetical protein